MNRYYLTALLVSILAPILLVFLTSLSNRRKEERYKQWPFVLMAIAYAVFCIIEYPKITKWVDELLALPFMNLIQLWVQDVNPLTYGIKLYYALLMNILILLGFLVIKNGGKLIGGILGSIINSFHKKSVNNASEGSANVRMGMFGEMLDHFYHIKDGTGMVRAKWAAVGKSMRNAAVIIGIILSLLAAFAQIPLFNDYTWYPYRRVEDWLDMIYIWPAISAAVIFEIIFFLGGNEKFASGPKNKQKNGIAQPPVDYTPLIPKYENLFPERFAGTLKVPMFPEKPEDIQPEGEFASALYDRLRTWESKTGKQISKSVFDTILSLPDRQNTLIDTQLCDDFGECLMIYFNILLARGENVLVLCRNESTCEIMQEYIRSAFKQINGLTPIWIVNSSREAYATGDCDVLVTTPETIMDDPVVHAQSRLLSGLTTVLMLDTSRLVSETSSLMMAVSEKISAGKKNAIQYIGLCNGIPAELQSNIELILSPGRNFRTCECFTSSDSTRIMLWNYEPTGEGNVKKAQENLFRNSMDHVYLGVAVPLACAGVRYNVKTVSIMGSSIPALQLQDALRLGNSMMSQFFTGDILPNQVPERLQYQDITSENPFIIAVDETYNLPNTIRGFSRYGGISSAMVHVVSKSYMLRDFFASHAGEYLLDKAKMDMFSIPLGDPVKNVAARLIFEAGSDSGLTEDRLIKTIQSITGTRTSLRKALELTYSIARNGETTDSIESYFAVKTVSSFNRKTNNFEYKRLVVLKQPGRQLLKGLIGDVQPAKLKIDDEEISLGIPRGSIYQYYLPDQALVVKGRMYYIDFIDRQRGQLIAGTTIDKMDVPVDYVQHRQYTLNKENMRSERRVKSEMSQGSAEEIHAESYEVELLRDVKISVSTLGQIVPDPAFPVLDLTTKSRYRELSPSVQSDARRVYRKGSVISIRFNGIDEKEADRTAITLSVLLNELMKTLFPYTWQCIAVCPVLHDQEQDEGDGILFENLALAYPQLSPSMTWSCDPNTAEVLIIEDSEKDSGMIDALFRNRQDPFKNIFTILREYLQWQRTFEPKDRIQINADYLKFGAQEFPAYFNFSFVEEILKQLETVHPVDVPWIDPTAASQYCYFCHKDLRITDYIMLYDEEGKKDRKVCTECEKRLLSRNEDLYPLFEQTKEYLCGTFGIKLPKNISVKFVSAAKIAKQMKKKRRRFRYVGLADSLTNTIWIETNSPKEYILRTLVHELTHIWQFNNLKCDDIVAIEGHSSYMEVRYLHDLGYNALSEETKMNLQLRTNDEYGKGFAQLCAIMAGRTDDDTFKYMLEKYAKSRKNK